MSGTHSTPLLRDGPLRIEPIVEGEDDMKDLDGLALTERLFRRYGYRIEKFTEGELSAMCHCKTCGLRVSSKAERRRQKPTKAEKNQEKQRIARMEEILERKLQEALPALRSRDDNQGPIQPEPDWESDDWETPWPTDEPQDENTPPLRCFIPNNTNRLKYDPESAHGQDGLIRKAYWKNDVNKWVGFEIALNKHEANVFVAPGQKERRPTCLSHPGRVRDGHWTCCGASPGDSGCIVQDTHPAVEDVDEFKDDMKLFHTPEKKTTDQRGVIALDCEMGISKRGESELIQISAVDFFTGEVLLDSLVYPKVAMKHLNPRFSGVDWKLLNLANKKGQCINGREEARRRLFQWVGPETIVITHGGCGDLLALRWIHPLVLDTLAVECRRQGPQPVKTLVHLTQVLLHRKIQQSYDGHDCLEDTVACRDLAKWYVDNLAAYDKVRPDDEFDNEHHLSRVDSGLLQEWMAKQMEKKASKEAQEETPISWPDPEPWED